MNDVFLRNLFANRDETYIQKKSFNIGYSKIQYPNITIISVSLSPHLKINPKFIILKIFSFSHSLLHVFLTLSG